MSHVPENKTYLSTISIEDELVGKMDAGPHESLEPAKLPEAYVTQQTNNMSHLSKDSGAS